MTPRECPIVDLRDRRATELAADASLHDAMVFACEHHGYFAVRGHGISHELLSAARLRVLEFFERPIAEKTRVLANAKCAGYVPPLTSGDPSLVCFPREAYNVIPEEMTAIWPAYPESFERVLSRCFSEMSALCMDVLRAMIAAPRGLRLDGTGELEQRFIGSRSLLRATLYGEIDPSECRGLLRCEPHTDLGVLSIIDSTFEPDGFQVELDDGTWIDVLPLPDTLLVILGDEMKRWMNGAWRSPVHRVANPSVGVAKRRLSLIYFHNPVSVRGDVERYLASSSIAVHKSNPFVHAGETESR